MNCITLDHVLPRAFAVTDGSSVWGRRISFRRGERVRVEASSGSGKTTLCAFVMGMRGDYSGNILFDDSIAGSFSPERWSVMRREHLAWLPQEIGLFPQLTLRDNILLKNSLTNFRTEAWIEETCFSLGIGECLDRHVSRMSIGQQQRGGLVRALCQPADFIFLDEPVSHLDAHWNAAVADLVDRELSESGAGLVITSVGHHLDIRIDTCISL